MLNNRPAQPSDRLSIVSCDTHVGPSAEQLRPYCESSLLDDFDDFYRWAFERGRAPRAGTTQVGERRRMMLEHVARSGEADSASRLKAMDNDGIAAEVIFHGSQNENALPFGFGGRGDNVLQTKGLRIYNRWLADFCAAAPNRRVGLMQIPGWDPEASVREVQTGFEAGLKAINFPALRPSDESRPLYTSKRWEPFWDICSSLGLVLANHGAADLDILREPSVGNYALACTEVGWLARRAIWWLIFDGVFDRHPTLKVVITENTGEWPRTDLVHLDSAYQIANLDGDLDGSVDHEPSWYFHHNIWFGASLLSSFELDMYRDLNMLDRVLWGSDYPHIEGTWPNTLLALRVAFSNASEREIRQVLCDTPAEAYGLDTKCLEKVALGIGPTLADVQTPVDEIPFETRFSMAFRKFGSFT